MSRFILFVAAAALAGSLAAPPPARAAWPNSPYVNQPVCTAAGAQYAPNAIPDGAGGAIIAFTDERLGAGTDVYVQHVLASGALDPAWPAEGRALCTATNNQYSPRVTSDGAGGAIVVWQDLRNGTNYDLYAQRVLASGALDPAWPVDGRGVCTNSVSQSSLAVATDGAGGVFVTWYESSGATGSDVFAQHLLPAGTLDPAWPAAGLPVSVETGLQSFPTIAAGAPGTAYITWRDTRGATWDIYAMRVVAGVGVDPAWPVNGRPVCSAAGTQDFPQVTSDGVGGAILGWRDLRSGVATDVYAHHLLPTGVDPAWPVDGRAICLAYGAQGYPQLAGDGAGGAFLVWDDQRNGLVSDLFASHVLSSGVVDPAIPVDGVAVCTATNTQDGAQIAPDGFGGAYVAWNDYRSGSAYDTYAQHVLAGGTLDPAFPYDGKPIALAANNQSSVTVVHDGAGGAILAWADVRSGTSDVYAQRLARFGQLGTPEGEMVGVADVPNDQGGRVKLSWNASWLDLAGSPLVTAYDVLRSVPPQAALARTAGGARLLAADAGAFAPKPGDLVALPAGATITYWEYLASVPALHFTPGYSYVAPTTGDSLAGSNPRTGFLVLAHNDGRTQYWPSAPAAGYSVDNLAPLAPAPFTGTYSTGATRLHWDSNSESDLAGYRLYRGSSADFVPGPANLVASLADTGYADPGAAGGYYKLSAVDVHGNEGGFALLAPAQVAGVEGGGFAGVLAFARPVPSPANVSTALRFTLPHAGRVSLDVWDAAGRRVRTLLAEERTAGSHAVTWDLRGERGEAVAAGVYFLRLEFEGRALTQRVVALQ